MRKKRLVGGEKSEKEKPKIATGNSYLISRAPEIDPFAFLYPEINGTTTKPPSIDKKAFQKKLEKLKNAINIKKAI